MTSKQENNLSMYLTFKDFQGLYTELTAALPNYTTNLTLFTSTINAIQLAAEQQKVSKKGVTENKQQLREDLTTKTIDYALKLGAFAKFTNNLVLVQEVKLNISKLRKAPDTAVRDYAQIVYDRAQTNLADLEDYVINEDTQTAMEDAIAAYNAALGKPGVSRIESGINTKQLKTLFETADTALDNMDTVVEILRFSEQGFYAAYKNARKVIDRTNGMSVRGLVTDASNGAPIKGVTLSFSGSTNLVKKTAEKGRFNIKSLASGMYTVTAQKVGYEDQSTTVTIADGELTTLQFQLSKN